MYRRPASQTSGAKKRSSLVRAAKKNATKNTYSAVRSQAVPTSAARAAPKRAKRSYNFAPLGTALGGIAGTLLGGPAGTALGASLGHAGGSLINTISGLGDYRISYNTLAANSAKLMSGDSVPAVQNTHSGVRICHREYIADISSSVGFTNTTYPINPGVSTTFPWLSAVAQNFQQYRLHGMIFSFVSTSADALNSTNTALGTVVLATNYNASQGAFTSKGQMENNEFTTSSRPSANVMHMIECDPNITLQEGKFYIRTGSLPANQDIKTYDVGLFQIATVGSQAASVIGELHVSYDIELMKPIDLSQTNNSNAFAHYYANTGVSTSNYFGTAQTQRYDNLGLTISSNKLTLPSAALPGQQYMFTLWWGGSSTAVVAPTLTFANCTQKSYFTAGGATSLNGGGNTSTVLPQMFIISVDSTAGPATLASVTLSGGTLPASAVCEFFVDAIPAAAI